MTGSYQRDKSAEAFWRQLSLKEVHLSSCLKQNLFPPRLIRTVVGGREAGPREVYNGGWVSTERVTVDAEHGFGRGAGQDRDRTQ